MHLIERVKNVCKKSKTTRLINQVEDLIQFSNFFEPETFNSKQMKIKNDKQRWLNMRHLYYNPLEDLPELDCKIYILWSILNNFIIIFIAIILNTIHFVFQGRVSTIIIWKWLSMLIENFF